MKSRKMVITLFSMIFLLVVGGISFGIYTIWSIYDDNKQQTELRAALDEINSLIMEEDNNGAKEKIAKDLELLKYDQAEKLIKDALLERMTINEKIDVNYKKLSVDLGPKLFNKLEESLEFPVENKRIDEYKLAFGEYKKAVERKKEKADFISDNDLKSLSENEKKFVKLYKKDYLKEQLEFEDTELFEKAFELSVKDFEVIKKKEEMIDLLEQNKDSWHFENGTFYSSDGSLIKFATQKIDEYNQLIDESNRLVEEYNKLIKE
ncbi:MAG: hypothetical protein ACRCUP_02325 [Mycoplasmatales bacterium]